MPLVAALYTNAMWRQLLFNNPGIVLPPSQVNQLSALLESAIITLTAQAALSPSMITNILAPDQ